MNPKVRLVLYVLLLGCMAACTVGFLAVYRSAEPPPATPAAAPDTQPATNFVVTTNAAGALVTNEEVLKRRLPAERWGWAAVHLANLYSGKLNRTEQATALLRRIVEDYGKTAAARKARERLGIPEPVEVPLPSAELTAVPAPVPAA